MNFYAASGCLAAVRNINGHNPHSCCYTLNTVHICMVCVDGLWQGCRLDALHNSLVPNMPGGFTSG